MKPRRKKYYAISGKNGYGVCDTQRRCKKLKKYVREGSMREFEDPYKAQSWVYKIYYEYEENKGTDFCIGEIEKMNEAKFRKKFERKLQPLFSRL